MEKCILQHVYMYLFQYFVASSTLKQFGNSVHIVYFIRRRRKKHRLVIEVESFASSSKKKVEEHLTKILAFIYSNNMH